MTDLERYLGKFENQEIWCCDYYATRMNLQTPFLSLCHDAYVGQQVIGELRDYTPEKYYKCVAEVVRENEATPLAHCRTCEKCKRQIFKLKKLNWITINTSWYCNSSCIYCAGHYASKEDGQEVLSVIKKFHEQNLFESDCLFDWGGGEPTLNPIFADTSRWLSDHKYMQRINTNGIIYSDAVEYALKTGYAILRMSLDSGTKKCFEKVKGHSEYSQVWNNIERYRKISSEIYLKYNVFNYNSELSEIDAFLDKCENVDVHNIIIDGEVTSYQPMDNAGPFYYTEKEFNAMHYLQDEALKRGFNVEISDYAFSYRVERDRDGKLILPTKFIDNTDRKIISNEIYVETEPSVNSFINRIKSSNKKIIIRGFGIDGQRILKILNSQGIGIDYIVDINAEKYCAEEKVKGIDEYLSDQDDCLVILASTSYWKEFLREINVSNKTNFEPVYMMGYYFYKYAEAEGML